MTVSLALSSYHFMTLTCRQYEIALLVTRGCTNREIGSMLGISVNAVKKHVSRVLVVLDVSNRTELAAVAGGWPPERVENSKGATRDVRVIPNVQVADRITNS